MNYYEMLQHYKSDLSEDHSLIDEAIATMEHYFTYLSADELLHHSRPLAIAYLALKELIKNGKDNNMKEQNTNLIQIPIEQYNQFISNSVHLKLILEAFNNSASPSRYTKGKLNFDEDIFSTVFQLIVPDLYKAKFQEATQSDD